MARTIGICLMLVVTVVSGYRGVSMWAAEMRNGVATQPNATGQPSREPTSEPESLDAAPSQGGVLMTIRNDMPATISITTQPEGKTYRVPWGGGDMTLGDTPVHSLMLVYHDPYWPYVYRLTCPAGEERCTLRMSELWKGRIPQGFWLRRGRLNGLDNTVVWIDRTDTPNPPKL